MIKIIKYINRSLISIYYNLFYDLKIDITSSYKDPLVLEGGKNIKIGKNCVIGRKSWLSAHKKIHNKKFLPEIHIGNNVHIGNFSFITATNKIEIGNGTLISDYFFCTDHTHKLDPLLNLPVTYHPIETKEETKIGENCFIGIRVSIMPGIKIGDKCIIGSHSVVTKDIPNYSMAVGNPAKVIKTFDFTNKTWKRV